MSGSGVERDVGKVEIPVLAEAWICAWVVYPWPRRVVLKVGGPVRRCWGFKGEGSRGCWLSGLGLGTACGRPGGVVGKGHVHAPLHWNRHHLPTGC